MGHLTVAEARHLLQNEGGELTPTDIVLHSATALIVAAFTARALWIGQATAWHLALPMVAQYLVLLAVIPVAQLFVRNPALNRDVFGSLCLWVMLAAAVAVAALVRARSHQTDWQAQLARDAELLRAWIVDAHMHWAILAAALGTLLELPGRLRNLRKFGPPFVGVSLGCGMRVAVLVLGCFLIPVLASDPRRMAWGLWAALLLAEGLALAMHWDVQQRLQKLDRAARQPAASHRRS
ncbi:MAG TPA: hypothetical protein PJ982_13270 [Lacipirellulaceae bacterium]|nr:hypothetical protein [Lacipirellulaceae bacterium]